MEPLKIIESPKLANTPVSASRLKAANMGTADIAAGCDSLQSFHRRRFLRSGSMVAGGLLSQSMLTKIAERLSIASESSQSDKLGAKSLILLWMQGGPSQLETFDPHAGHKIGGETKAMKTSVPGLQIASTLPRTAEIMHRATLVRSIVSKEGDHERATYNMKTGWRPDPTLIHPAIGSVICHQTEDNIEIPRSSDCKFHSTRPSPFAFLVNHLNA